MNRKNRQNIKDISIWKILLFILAIIGCQTYSYAQFGDNGNPINTEALFRNQQVSTPATAALKQNIVYPVNHSTGLPEIKIPLYEVQCGDITLPIYLTYHASGIKLNDVAGWAGLGWNLVAEPMISRTIRGCVDDPRTMTCEFDKNSVTDWWLTKRSTEEPDEYYYRLSNKQGMFMYAMEPTDKSRKFLPIPYDNIRIDWTGKRFQITDDDGTMYKFDGGIEDELSVRDIIAWKASAIVSSNKKDSISFFYSDNKVRYLVKMHDYDIVVRDRFSIKAGLATDRQSGPYGTSHYPDECMQDPIIISKINDRMYGYQCDDAGELFPDGGIYGETIHENDIDTRSQPLSEIHFSQGKIIFTKDPKFPRIQKMTVYDTNGMFIKEIRFNYYPPIYSDIQRYFLENIVIIDKDEKVKESYLFSYEEATRLPYRGNRSIDYWGYFNGIDRPDDVTLVPKQTIETTRLRNAFNSAGYESAPNINLTFGSELSREADEEYMKYGTLKSITYPTGSTDEFVYQAHHYKDDQGVIKQAGGLRIKQIKTKSKNGNMKCRSFTYGRNEDGCGTPFTTNVLDYFRLVQELFFCDIFSGFWQNGEYQYAPIPGENGYARQRTFFSSPTRPIAFDGGSTVMYDYVTEYNGTEQMNSGKIVYEYSIDKTHFEPDDANTIQQNPHDGWMYGQLTRKTVFRNDNKKYTPLEETEYNYSTDDKSFGKILVGEAVVNYIVRESSINRIPPEVEKAYTYERTEVSVGSKLLKWSKNSVFTDGGTIFTQSDYKYDNPSTTYPTSIAETGKGVDKHVTNIKYPQDYGNIFPYADMVKCNIISPVVKNEYIRGSEYIGIETSYVKSSDNVYKPGSLTVSRSPSAKGEIRATYLYDNSGRIRQEVRDGKETIVYLYGYKNQHIVAQIENATFAEVEAKMGTGIIAEMADQTGLSNFYLSKLNNLRYSLPASRVTIYTYKPLVGIASITNPLGVSTYYDYDGLGRLTKTYCINNNKEELIESYGYHYAQ